MKLLQKYGPLPEELCRVYFAELVVIIGIIHILINYLNYFQIVNNILFNIIKNYILIHTENSVILVYDCV